MKRPIMSPVRPGVWELLEDYHWDGIRIPAGFQWDGDSVPRIPGVYAKFKGRTIVAALIHDYLYRVQTTSRKTADRKMNKAMIQEGTGTFHRVTIYRTLRIAGWPAWNHNAKRVKAARHPSDLLTLEYTV